MGKGFILWLLGVPFSLLSFSGFSVSFDKVRHESDGLEDYMAIGEHV